METNNLDVVGRTIVAVRPMTPQEMREYWWLDDSPAVVLVLDDGTILFPSQDDEGNGPGAMFGQTPEGEDFTIFVYPEGHENAAE